MTLFSGDAEHFGDHDGGQWPRESVEGVELRLIGERVEQLGDDLLDVRGKGLYVAIGEALRGQAAQTRMVRRIDVYQARVIEKRYGLACRGRAEHALDQAAVEHAAADASVLQQGVHIFVREHDPAVDHVAAEDVSALAEPSDQRMRRLGIVEDEIAETAINLDERRHAELHAAGIDLGEGTRHSGFRTARDAR